MIALIDLECTGLDPQRHEIVEIACLLVDEDTLEAKDSLEAKVHPVFPENADPRALEVNGYNDTDWRDAWYLPATLVKLSEMANGATMMAYNVSFDHSFLQEAFRKTGIKDTMDHHRLDLATLAWEHLPKEHSLSLKSVCETLGILPEPAIHRAMNGAVCAYEVLVKLMRADTN